MTMAHLLGLKAIPCSIDHSSSTFSILLSLIDWRKRGKGLGFDETLIWMSSMNAIGVYLFSFSINGLIMQMKRRGLRHEPCGVAL